MRRVAIVLLVAGAFTTGHFLPFSKGVAEASSRPDHQSARRILYYRCPMHPAYRSPMPGVAPCCHMAYEPVFEADEQTGAQGSIHVSSETRKLLGIHVTQVAAGSATGALRVLGKVVIDENRIYRLTTATEGWIRYLSPASTGTVVVKTDLLARFYAREFQSAQQAYIYALSTVDHFTASEHNSVEQQKLNHAQVQASEEVLLSLGMGGAQIEAIARSREVAKEIELRAPEGGLILSRSVYPNGRFERGVDLYRIADIRSVWITAEVPWEEMPHLRPGMRLQIAIPGIARRSEAVVSTAFPLPEENTHTLKVRLEANNASLLLRPEMPVEVFFPTVETRSLRLPSSAVLNNGTEQVVFVERQPGTFLPQSITTGRQWDEQVEIKTGLTSGDRVVSDGAFLLDSETKFRASSRQ